MLVQDEEPLADLNQIVDVFMEQVLEPAFFSFRFLGEFFIRTADSRALPFRHPHFFRIWSNNARRFCWMR